MITVQNETKTPVMDAHLPDFSNTEVAFSYLTDKQLKRTSLLFRLMNKSWFVRYAGPIGLWCVKYNFPFARWITKLTLYKHFVGGHSLLGTQDTISMLARYKTLTILDYGVEATESEEDFNRTMRENLRAIEFASKNNHVPVVSTKISGLASNDLLEKASKQQPLSQKEENDWRSVIKRVEAISASAYEKNVSVFYDAEETWIQDAINDLVVSMMRQFNKEQVVVYNTFQMYRKDQLDYLKHLAEMASNEGWMLGAKIVRGAYMEKERERAVKMGYPSPIFEGKEGTDQSYNDALVFLLEHYQTIGICNASHNAVSNELMARVIHERGFDRTHRHLNFSQLFGMSDNLTFNLAEAGYNVAKYVPYGQVEDVIPYLIRRAQENSSVTGDMSRELRLIKSEMARRAKSQQRK